MDQYNPVKVAAKMAGRKIKWKLAGKLLFPLLPVVLGVFILLFFAVILIAIADVEVPSDLNSGLGVGGTITEEASGLIPREYLNFYYEAEEIYGVPWNILAAVHAEESDFGRNIQFSVSGKVGHMQFPPKMWVGQSYPYAAVLPEDLVNPTIIVRYSGYGVDADGDGRADPDSAVDSIYALAYFLSENGAAAGKYSQAVYAYCASEWYVQMVLDTAKSYITTSGTEPDYGDYNTGGKVVSTAVSKIGNTMYIFGGGRTEVEAARGIYDCSSFVWWVFKENGVTLGDLTDVNTETLNKLGKRIPLEDARPGDLVFWDTYKTDGHVAIYIGNNKCIGCQNETGAAIIDMQDLYWQSVFKGHVRRLIAE